MLKIEKRFVVDDEGKPIAVQIDLETFKKIEEILEDYGLAKEIQAVEDEESLDITAARERYKQILKEP